MGPELPAPVRPPGRPALKKLKLLLPDTKFIASGGFLLVYADEVLQSHPYIDAIIKDFTSPDVVSYIKGEYLPITSLVYRDHKGKIVSCDARGLKDEFEVPIPRHDLFPLERYRFPTTLSKRFTVVKASHGCPYRCSFCVQGTIPYKRRTLENVLLELEHIRSLGIEEVLFQDAVFTYHEGYTRALCEQMTGLGLKWTCLARADQVNPELLRRMKRAGCHTIQFGVESGNEQILKKVKQGLDKDTIRQAIAWCREMGLRTNGFFILGFPEETEESLRETLDFALELDTDMAVFNLLMYVVGTELWSKGWERGHLLEAAEDSSRSSINRCGIEEEILWKYKMLSYTKFYFRPRYILRHIGRLNSIFELKNSFHQAWSLLKHNTA